MGLATEDVVEVIRVSAWDGVRVCDQLAEWLCERNGGCCLLFQAAVAELPEACSWA
jgi:hypothetical protein